ncbi:MAG: hypothetical protein JJU03_00165 [Idiomarina sp.]|nr:hypothetical protein [Idiomarina sp.]
MNSFIRTFIAFLIYWPISRATGTAYRIHAESFDFVALAIDFGLFAVIFTLVWWITGKTRLGRKNEV